MEGFRFKHELETLMLESQSGLGMLQGFIQIMELWNSQMAIMETNKSSSLPFSSLYLLFLFSYLGIKD